MISTLLLATLLVAPPDEVISPTQPQPGEPAIAPAVIEGERAGPEAMPAQPTDPVPVQQPQPPPDQLPSWEAQPQPQPQPQPPPNGYDQAQPQPYGYDQPVPWTTPVQPPPPPVPKPPVGGAPLFGAAAGLFGLIALRQGITSAWCEDLYCGNRGIFDHVMMLGVTGLAAGGGWLEGKRVVWKREQAGLPPANPVGRRVSGWLMFSLGFAGIVTDFALYNACYSSAAGPYTKVDLFVYTCSPGLSAVITDLSGLVGGVGAGLALSAESQLRTQRAAGARLRLLPQYGRNHVGLSLAGRF
ncbi:MAG: hypothetical protein KC457_01675 [Myxococcales bacterium]|nr:hypothetical protein [Myxococcales bacterium]